MEKYVIMSPQCRKGKLLWYQDMRVNYIKRFTITLEGRSERMVHRWTVPSRDVLCASVQAFEHVCVGGD